MQLKIWNFPKRVNSTKIPTSSAPWSPGVEIKAPTSMLNPVFRLGSAEDFAQINSYNYLQVDNGPYYFIDYWTSERQNLWNAHCTLDYLATYRAEILATSAFVEYDTSANPGIIDHRLSTVETVTRRATATTFSPPPFAGGSYILTVTGEEGSVGIYALSEGALGNLLRSVKQWSENEVQSTEIVDVMKEWAVKAISVGSAAENIRSCIWVPWFAQGVSEEIYLGRYPTGQAGRKLSEDALIFSSHTVTIPWQADDWRRASLFHTFELYLPYVGVVGVDAGLLEGLDTITVDSNTDTRTGDVAYIVRTGINVIGAYAGNASAQIPIGVSNVSPLKIGASIFTGVAAVIAQNPVGVGTSIAQAATNVLNPTVSSIGTLQSSAGATLDNLDIEMNSFFKNTNVAPSSVSAVMGTPTMSVKTLGSISGFCKTRGASVSANAGKGELDTINRLLDGGVFIE